MRVLADPGIFLDLLVIRTIGIWGSNKLITALLVGTFLGVSTISLYYAIKFTQAVSCLSLSFEICTCPLFIYFAQEEQQLKIIQYEEAVTAMHHTASHFCSLMGSSEQWD